MDSDKAMKPAMQESGITHPNVEMASTEAVSPPAYTTANQRDAETVEAVQPQPSNAFPSHLIVDETQFTKTATPNSNPVQVETAQPNQTTNIQALGAPPRVRLLNQLREEPEFIDCPFCQKMTKTRVNKEATTMTTIAGIFCCLLCICAACVPCLFGWCHDTDHYCTNCNAKVAHLPHDGVIQVFSPVATGTVPSKYAPVKPMQYPQAQQELKEAPPAVLASGNSALGGKIQ